MLRAGAMGGAASPGPLDSAFARRLHDSYRRSGQTRSAESRCPLFGGTPVGACPNRGSSDADLPGRREPLIRACLAQRAFPGDTGGQNPAPCGRPRCRGDHIKPNKPPDIKGEGAMGTMTESGLDRGAIGLREVVFQSVTSMAPAGAVALSIAASATYAGGALPLAVLLALIACLLVATSIGQLAKHLPSAGSIYTYPAEAIHPALGFLVGW